MSSLSCLTSCLSMSEKSAGQPERKESPAVSVRVIFMEYSPFNINLLKQRIGSIYPHLSVHCTLNVHCTVVLMKHQIYSNSFSRNINKVNTSFGCHSIISMRRFRLTFFYLTKCDYIHLQRSIIWKTTLFFYACIRWSCPEKSLLFKIT